MDHHDLSYNHPSQSIPDAAYPQDSPYQPGQVGSGTPLGASSSQVHITPVSTHQTYTPSQSSIPLVAVTPFSHQSPATSSATPWSADDPRNDVIPSSPPPPYEPTSIPAAYSPLGDSSHNLTQTQSIPDPNVQPTPTASTHYPPSPQSSQAPYPPPSPNPYSAGSSVENGPPKLGPVAEARRRKKRRMRICMFTMCAIFLFLVALTVGVAVGVLKVQSNGNNDNQGNDSGSGSSSGGSDNSGSGSSDGGSSSGGGGPPSSTQG